MKDQATELPLRSQVRRGKKHQVCFPSLRGCSRPARSDGILPGAKPKDAEYLRVVWPLAASCGSRRNQDAAIWIFVLGTLLGKYREQPQDGPKSLISSTLGARGKAGEPTAPSLLAPGGRGLPSALPRIPSLSDPAIARHHADSGSPAPLPVRPAARGGGRQWQLQHTANWAGFFFLYFFPPFPHLRAARCPHCSR